MKSNFQAGVNTVYNAVVAKGVTPASKTPSAIATAIGNINTGYSYYGKLTVTKFTAQSGIVGLRSGDSESDVKSWYDGVADDVWPYPFYSSIGGAYRTFTVTFNRSIAKILLIRNFQGATAAGYGVWATRRVKYNNIEYNNNNTSSGSIWTETNVNIDLNSKTFTFQAACASTMQHYGSSEWEFYGLY